MEIRVRKNVMIAAPSMMVFKDLHRRLGLSASTPWVRDVNQLKQLTDSQDAKVYYTGRLPGDLIRVLKERELAGMIELIRVL